MSERKATASAEYHLHQYHWLHARDLRALRGEEPGARVALDCSALLLIAFAIEAHANRLLELGCPAKYEKERTFFGSGTFRGSVGKLEFLAERLSVQVDRGARPFQSVGALFTWRDRMVHTRVERVVRVEPYTDPSQVQPPESELLAFPGKCGDRILADAEAFAGTLQAAANAAGWKGIHVPKAFTGFLGLRGVSL